MKNIFNAQNRATAGLALGHFSIEIYAALLVPLYPLITTKLGINLAQISFVIAIGHLISSMMQPYFGYIADKLTHRIFLVWGLVVTSVFIPFSIKYNSVYIFMLFLMLGMMGNAFFHPQASSLAKDFNKDNPNISKAMGFFLGLGTIGYALGPYLGTFCVDKFGYENLIYTCILGVLYAAVMYFLVPKIPQKLHIDKDNFFKVTSEILKNKTCVILVLISSVKSLVSICFGTYVPFLLKENNFDLNTTGLIVTLFFISGGVASMTSSKIERKIGTRGVIALSMLGILPLCCIFLAFLNNFKIFSILCFILIGYFILLSVGIILVKAQKALYNHTGVISGAIQGFGWGIGALFLAPMGILGQIWGIDKILITVSLIAFITGLYCLRAKSVKF